MTLRLAIMTPENARRSASETLTAIRDGGGELVRWRQPGAQRRNQAGCPTALKMLERRRSPSWACGAVILSQADKSGLHSVTTDSNKPTCDQCSELLNGLPQLPLPQYTMLATNSRDRMASLLAHRYLDHRDSIAQIAALSGYSYGTVNRTLREANVELRGRGGRRAERMFPASLGGGYTFTAHNSAGELLVRGFRAAEITAPVKPDSRTGAVSLSEVPLLRLIAALVEHHATTRPDERKQLLNTLQRAHARLRSNQADGNAQPPTSGTALSTLRLFQVSDGTISLLKRLFPDQGLEIVSASLSQHLDGPCPADCLWDELHPEAVERINTALLAWQNVGWAEAGLFDSA